MKYLLLKLKIEGLAFFAIILCFFYFYDSMSSYLKIIGVAVMVLCLLFLYRPWEDWLLLIILFLPLEIGWIEFVSYFLLFSAGFLLVRFAFSFLFFKTAQKLIPKISETEKVALQVGESWLEKEFFTGRPNFKTLLGQKIPFLSQQERNFLDNQTEELCSLSAEWDFLKRKKLSLEEEECIKHEKFLGLIIPKQHEGLGFSPFAHAKVIEKLASHNIPLSIITMVPNSLGPAELLLKYGTETQKDQYLRSLAQAKLWPCFGLTEAQAGSDASAIQSEGVLFKEGKELKIRLNFEKRWITLSAKADLIGLAIQLKDPDQIYSEKKDLGITCVLVPSHLKGIERGFYHDSMGLPIYNSPIKGRDVIVSAESAIIGGLKQAGQGWKMLMESLSAGRSISLPALSTACGKRVSWLVGTHAFVRKQFGQPIGKFSAIQEKLAEIAGLTHLITSVHTFTLSGLNQKIVSPVVSAFTKYQLTELAQKIVKQGMDVMGGAGLSLGPKNKIACLHTSLPLAITVEGANTLSRTFIVYAQGLIKTHPQAYDMIQALENNNLKSFHKKIWSFLYHTLCHFIRACVFTLTRAYLAGPLFKVFFIKALGAFYKILFFLIPSSLLGSYLRKRESLRKSEKLKQDQYRRARYLQKLAWSASLFAFLSNLNLLFLGDRLKTKGQFNGRFADWLSFQYMISAVLWQNKSGGASWLVSKWALDYCFLQIQNNLMDILNNYPVTAIRWFLKPLSLLLRLNPLGLKPSDKLDKKLANKLLEDKEFKQELCKNMYFPKDKEDQFQKLKQAYDLSLKEREILNKIKASFKANKINCELCQSALRKGIISQEEFNTLKQAKKAQREATQADAFSEQEYFKSRF